MCGGAADYVQYRRLLDAGLPGVVPAVVSEDWRRLAVRGERAAEVCRGGGNRAEGQIGDAGLAGWGAEPSRPVRSEAERAVGISGTVFGNRHAHRWDAIHGVVAPVGGAERQVVSG